MVAARWPFSAFLAACRDYWISEGLNSETAERWSQHACAPVCRKLGISLVADWEPRETADGQLVSTVPVEIIKQLEGRIFSPGMRVNYQGQDCVVVDIAVITMDELSCHLDRYSIVSVTLALANQFDLTA